MTGDHRLAGDHPHMLAGKHRTCPLPKALVEASTAHGQEGDGTEDQVREGIEAQVREGREYRKREGRG